MALLMFVLDDFIFRCVNAFESYCTNESRLFTIMYLF